MFGVDAREAAAEAADNHTVTGGLITTQTETCVPITLNAHF